MYGLGFAEKMGPPVDPNQPVEPPDVQQQIADVWSYLWEGPGSVVTSAPAPSPWIQGLSNSTLAIGGAVLALVLVLGRRR